MSAQLCTRRASGFLHHSDDKTAVWSGKIAGAHVHLCANCRAYDLAREQAVSQPDKWLDGRGMSAGAVYALAALIRGPVTMARTMSKQNASTCHWLRMWARSGLVERQGEVFRLAGGAK